MQKTVRNLDGARLKVTLAQLRIQTEEVLNAVHSKGLWLPMQGV